MSLEVTQPQSVTFTSSNVPIDDAPAYDAMTTYDTDDLVVFDDGVWECQADSTTGIEPGTDPAKWVLLGPINRLRMLDLTINQATTNPDSIEVVFTQPGFVNRMGFFGLVGVTLEVVAEIDSVVQYERTVSLVDSSLITGFWAYFYAGRSQLQEVVLTDLPPLAGAEWTVTITAADGQDAVCAEMVVGKGISLGLANYGTTVGYIDFSDRSRSPDGSLNLLQRGTAAEVDYDCTVEDNRIISVLRTLKPLRQSICMFTGPPEREELIVLGVFDSFRIPISTPTISFMTLRVTGVT